MSCRIRGGRQCGATWVAHAAVSASAATDSSWRVDRQRNPLFFSNFVPVPY